MAFQAWRASDPVYPEPMSPPSEPEEISEVPSDMPTSLPYLEPSTSLESSEHDSKSAGSVSRHQRRVSISPLPSPSPMQRTRAVSSGQIEKIDMRRRPSLLTQSKKKRSMSVFQSSGNDLLGQEKSSMRRRGSVPGVPLQGLNSSERSSAGGTQRTSRENKFDPLFTKKREPNMRVQIGSGELKYKYTPDQNVLEVANRIGIDLENHKNLVWIALKCYTDMLKPPKEPWEEIMVVDTDTSEVENYAMKGELDMVVDFDGESSSACSSGKDSHRMQHEIDVNSPIDEEEGSLRSPKVRGMKPGLVENLKVVTGMSIGHVDMVKVLFWNRATGVILEEHPSIPYHRHFYHRLLYISSTRVIQMWRRARARRRLAALRSHVRALCRKISRNTRKIQIWWLTLRSNWRVQIWQWAVREVIDRVVYVQSWARMVEAMRYLRYLKWIKHCATMIQRTWWRYCAVRKVAAIKIQRWWRNIFRRIISRRLMHLFRLCRPYVIKIQAWWRMVIPRRWFLIQMMHRRLMARRIQHWWRTLTKQRKYLSMFQCNIQTESYLSNKRVEAINFPSRAPVDRPPSIKLPKFVQLISDNIPSPRKSPTPAPPEDDISQSLRVVIMRISADLAMAHNVALNQKISNHFGEGAKDRRILCHIQNDDVMSIQRASLYKGFAFEQKDDPGSTMFPEYTLRDRYGRLKRASSVASGENILYLFVRGGWCPFSNATLQAFLSNWRQYRSLAAKLVIVMPCQAVYAKETFNAVAAKFRFTQEEQEEIEVLCDERLVVSKTLGIEEWITPDIAESYRAYGWNLYPEFQPGQDVGLCKMSLFICDRMNRVRLGIVGDCMAPPEPNSTVFKTLQVLLRCEPPNVVPAVHAMAVASRNPKEGNFANMKKMYPKKSLPRPRTSAPTAAQKKIQLPSPVNMMNIVGSSNLGSPSLSTRNPKSSNQLSARYEFKEKDKLRGPGAAAVNERIMQASTGVNRTGNVRECQFND